MSNFMTFLAQSSPSKSQLAAIGGLVTILSLTTTLPAQAATPQTAPPALRQMLTQIDTAANQHDVRSVMQFYGANFTHSDGLTRPTMEKTLTQLWQRYPQLNYRTQLQSWQPEGRAIIAETVTNITGAQSQANRNLTLNATIRSRQRIENNKIVRQDILWERSQLSAGTKPPTVDVRLPQQVTAGQQFNFDAIVQEPLGDDYLLGAAIEEPVNPNGYFQPTPVELELLPAGGLYKLGRAPAAGNNRWISAILVRGDGMTLVTQRMQVVGANAARTSGQPK